MEDWKEEYRGKFISAEEAAKLVKPGDQVVFTMGREGHAVGLAIAARKEELKGVRIFVPTPTYDFGWYDEGWQDSFEITISFPTGTCQEAIDYKRCDLTSRAPISMYRPVQIMAADVVITEVSPPDEKGFCSFGQSLWNKKEQIKLGKTVIAEVNKTLIRTYGDNFIHVSEIDYFVEHLSSGGEPGKGSLAGRVLREPEPYLKDIAGYVSEIIKDRDTIQIGVGRTTEPLVHLGMLDNKHDLGVHTEATPPRIITLVKEGIINGKYKTIHQGKVIATSLGGGSKEEMEWAADNPLFELVNVSYLEDLRVIASNDNMVAINNALSVDLSGQITSESIGGQLRSTPGGQIPFVFGSLLSKGGRSITVLPSTALGGKASRIVPRFPEGTVVTIPRGCADYVVTEFGIARLWAKTLRQRAQELISVAHPDFRSELRKTAQEMLYP